MCPLKIYASSLRGFVSMACRSLASKTTHIAFD